MLEFSFFMFQQQEGKIRAKKAGHTISSSAVNCWEREHTRWLYEKNIPHSAALLSLSSDFFSQFLKADKGVLSEQMNSSTRWHESLQFTSGLTSAVFLFHSVGCGGAAATAAMNRNTWVAQKTWHSMQQSSRCAIRLMQSLLSVTQSWSLCTRRLDISLWLILHLTCLAPIDSNIFSNRTLICWMLFINTHGWRTRKESSVEAKKARIKQKINKSQWRRI